jgi:two-component system cell cycle sensor histidine kinase/response regulator CckA
VLGKVFEPFYTTKEVGKGTGSGSRRLGIVKQSGGFIFADSTLGQGTSFVIYLPVHHVDATTEVAPPPPREKPTELWGTGTILLVEDEDMVRAVAGARADPPGLSRADRGQWRAGAGAARASAMGCRQSRAAQIDLLVSDVVMPTMDGPTLVRHAREQFPKLPVLFMSGYAEEQLRRSIAIDRVAFLPNRSRSSSSARPRATRWRS